MKKITQLFLSLLFLTIIPSISYTQDMKPDAAKIYNEGYNKSQSGDYKGALDDFNKALKIEKDYRIYYQMGVAEAKLKDLNQAIADFENSLKVKPDFYSAYNDMGNAYFSLGKYQDAINSYEKILQTSNDDKLKNAVKFNIALAYTKLGNAAELDKKNNEAIDYLLKAVASYNYDAAYLFLAENYTITGQNDKAIEAAQNALKYRKYIKEGGPNYYLGVAYKNKGDMKNAKLYLAKAESDPLYKKLAGSMLEKIK